jgi:hypothetical protein
VNCEITSSLTARYGRRLGSKLLFGQANQDADQPLVLNSQRLKVWLLGVGAATGPLFVGGWTNEPQLNRRRKCLLYPQ